MGRGITPKVIENLPDNVRYLAHIVGSRNPGYIYFLVCSDLGIVKIGASNRVDGIQIAVDQRIIEVRNDVPFLNLDQEYVILAATLGRTETELHQLFAAYSVAGEWFVYSDDLKKYVVCVRDFLQQVEVMSQEGSALPTAMPWKMPEAPPKPPAKKPVRFQAVFE
jgi:hypothetical protein